MTMGANVGREEWFGGNKDALQVYRMLADLSHTWDDLVDRDKPVPQAHVNNAFAIALVWLHMNPYYRLIRDAVAPMWVSVIAAYETANAFEVTGERHGLEIAHNLRYAAGHIVAYMMVDCLGPQAAAQFMPEMWRDLACERIEPYLEEHLK